MTVAVDLATPIRISAAPPLEPPYDDEVAPGRHLALVPAGDAGARQQPLDLAFTLPNGLPAVPDLPAPLRAAEPPVPGEDERRITPRAELPDPARIAGRLAQAIVEVVAGARPAAQLARWTNDDVYADIRARLRRLARSGAPGLRGVTAGVVRSVRVSEPRDGVAEVCAVIARQGRATAMALRLDGLDGRWMCTELVFV